MDLRAEYRAIIDHVHRRDFTAAVAAADRVIGAAHPTPDARSRSLLGAVMMTRLDIKAQISPDPALVDESEALFERFAAQPSGPSALIAITALRIELQVLLRDPTDERIARAVKRLARFYEATSSDGSHRAIAKEVLTAVDWLTGRGHADKGLALAKIVRQKLAVGGDEATAALAQLWIVIAMCYGGARPAGFGQIKDPDDVFRTLRDMMGPRVSAVEAASAELEECVRFGEVALNAADLLIARFQSREGWAQAEAVTMIIEIVVLDDLGASERARQAVAELVARFEGVFGPAIDRVLAELRMGGSTT